MGLPQRPIGSQGLKFSAQGLGCMSLTPGFYQGNKEHQGSDEESTSVVHRALDLGVNFLDTMDLYTSGKNEELIGRALQLRLDKPAIVTKWGPYWKDGQLAIDASKERVGIALEGHLKRLQVDHIDIWILRGVDPKVPLEDTVTAMKAFVEQGKVRGIGLSEVSAADIRKAHAIHPITAVELEWSLWSRECEEEVVPTCRELGIGIIAYSPLGRGMLTGQIKSIDDFDEKDFRRHSPRFAGDAFAQNMKLVENVKALAAKKGVTAGQLALAWVHHQGEDVFPIPGTKRVKYLEENVAAFDIKLSTEELAELDAAVPPASVVGSRY